VRHINMKSIKKYLFLFLLPLLGCSTNKLSQVNQEVDNVYVSKAKAKEAPVYINNSYNESSETVERNDYKTEEEIYGDADDLDRYPDFSFNDFSFSSRIYRFNYSNPWRNYYDPFFDFRFDPFLTNDFYLDNYYFRNSSWWSINIYSGPSFYWNNPYRRPWILSPFNRYRWGNYGGIYSFYNPVAYPPFYGWNNGWVDYPVYYPGNQRLLRPRPRGGSDNIDVGMGNWNGGANRPSRADRYPTESKPSYGNGRSNGARPSRAQDNKNIRRETGNSNSGGSGTRAERYNPPASSGSSGSSRSNDSENKPRPSRSGGR
jgi:hypothetical protein